jgi:hypothetical protein
LTKKWFDLIKSGQKKVEYREIKEYWTKQLMPSPLKYIDYDEIHFKNGYSKNAPFMRVEFMGTMYAKKNEVDYLDPNKSYYKILLGKILEVKNYDRKKRI